MGVHPEGDGSTWDFVRVMWLSLVLREGVANAAVTLTSSKGIGISHRFAGSGFQKMLRSHSKGKINSTEVSAT